MSITFAVYVSFAGSSKGARVSSRIFLRMVVVIVVVAVRPRLISTPPRRRRRWRGVRSGPVPAIVRPVAAVAIIDVVVPFASSVVRFPPTVASARDVVRDPSHSAAQEVHVARPRAHTRDAPHHLQRVAPSRRGGERVSVFQSRRERERKYERDEKENPRGDVRARFGAVTPPQRRPELGFIEEKREEETDERRREGRDEIVIGRETRKDENDDGGEHRPGSRPGRVAFAAARDDEVSREE